MTGPGAARAIETLEQRARAVLVEAHARLDEALRTAGIETGIERLVDGVRANTRITLNFHPDRVGRDGVTVAGGLLNSGRYRPQSETGLSNGGRSAVPGGDRTNWERALFGPAYDDETITRPVYGALDITNDPHGGSPRFGSSYVVLAPHCFDRATFCAGDSHVGPSDVGTMRYFAAVLAALFEQAASGIALERPMRTDDLLRLLEGEAVSAATTNAPKPARSLDGYVEAQVHGAVSLAEDVIAIVVDPSFEGTTIEATLAEAASVFDFELRWHRGSELPAMDTPADFRGETMPALAHRVARPDGIVDAAAIGSWAARIPYTPPTPKGDPPESELQQYKRLWHCLLRFGRDAR